MVVETLPHTLVIGGGIAGLRAAVGLADIGLRVTLVERELQLGGWVRRFGPMYPHGREGRALIETLVAEVRRRPAITVLTGAEVVGKAGSFGNYRVSVRIGGEGSAAIEVAVGSIVVATGFESYQPEIGELGYGIEGVVTLPEFKELVDERRRVVDLARAAASAASPTSTASAAGSPRTPPRPTSTARASAARRPSRHRSRSPGWTRRSASSTSTATCGRTASSSRSTRSPARPARSS